MTLHVTKFVIPQDMIDDIEGGKTPLSTDFNIAIRDNEVVDSDG